mmetsp:Transcript_15797/g.19589  ORF Transcript_15797/g.19589 Transcript_15797/m.19589 type:complete len:224 (+) Transcript_15797:110-781(+)
MDNYADLVKENKEVSSNPNIQTVHTQSSAKDAVTELKHVEATLLIRKQQLENELNNINNELELVSKRLKKEKVTGNAYAALNISEENRVFCSICGRGFSPSRINKHERICQEVNSPEAIKRRALKRSPKNQNTRNWKFGKSPKSKLSSPGHEGFSVSINSAASSKPKGQQFSNLYVDTSPDAASIGSNQTSPDNPLATSMYQTAWHPPSSPRGHSVVKLYKFR